MDESVKFDIPDGRKKVPWEGAASTGLKISIFLGLTLRSLGVIYGDIGTSPLYVITTMFPQQPQDIEALFYYWLDDYISGCSLIIWSLLVMVFLKYVVFVLLANNKGEGGVLSLGCLLFSEKSSIKSPVARNLLRASMIIASCLLLADGAFTPAISVSSAVGGIALFAPSLATWVVPISIIILVILFTVQRYGTSRIGVAFGPAILIWFLVLLVGGAYNLALTPRAFAAFNPWLGLKFLFRQNRLESNVTSIDPVTNVSSTSTQVTYQSNYPILGSVFLAVTGLEALYADLGHFTAWPIRLGFTFIALPALGIQYLGQAAFLLREPYQVGSVFYRSFPSWALWPMIILATIATIIASQAIISGAFSVSKQAVSMGLIPPITIRSTSKVLEGQIYVPVANMLLLVLSVMLLIVIPSAESMANAYGVAVALVMFTTTIYYTLAIITYYRRPVILAVFFALFLIIDSLFIGAVMIKVPRGGWITIVISTALAVFLFSWWYGEIKLKKSEKTEFEGYPIPTLASHLIVSDGKVLGSSSSKESDKVEKRKSKKKKRSRSQKGRKSGSKTDAELEFVKHATTSGDNETVINLRGNDIHIQRRPGLGIFTTTTLKTTPVSFESFIHTLKYLPDHLLFVKVVNLNIAKVKTNNRFIFTNHGCNIRTLRIYVGFSEDPPVLLDVLHGLIASGDHPVVNRDDVIIVNGIETVSVKKHWFGKRLFLLIYEVLKNTFPKKYSKHMKLEEKQSLYVEINVKV